MRSTALDRVAARIVEVRAAPAAVCAAGFRSARGWHIGVGAAGTLWPKSSEPADPDSVFDLASLTKPVIAVAAATESTQGGFSWGARLGQLCPEWGGTAAGARTVEQLLSHRAGLLAHVELFQVSRAGRAFHRSKLLQAAANAQGSTTGRTDSTEPPVYSDLGYLLVGAAIERTYGTPLDRWLAERFPNLCRGKLGSIRNWLSWDPALRRRCAPTECVPWRGGIVWCRTHDENAWTLSGHGLCGHAGLFGTAAGVVDFGATVVDALAGLPSDVPLAAARMVTDERPGGSLCAGFDRKSPTGSSAGSLASPDAFGHLGFTGTSLWCDPASSVVVTILTNRVCPNRENLRVRALRPDIHDALFEWARAQQTGHPTANE